MACTTASAAQSSIGRLTANVEEAFAVANEFGSKADTAVALARKVTKNDLCHLRLSCSTCTPYALISSGKENAILKPSPPYRTWDPSSCQHNVRLQNADYTYLLVRCFH